MAAGPAGEETDGRALRLVDARRKAERSRTSLAPITEIWGKPLRCPLLEGVTSSMPSYQTLFDALCPYGALKIACP